VRIEAAARGLSVATKPDSHDICFISDGDTSGWLRSKLGAATGEIVDTSGEVLGTHEGTFGFTIGQRRGLRLTHPSPDGGPRYVLDIEPVTQRVTVGARDELAVEQLVCTDLRWCAAPVAGELECGVQLRAHGEEVPARARAVDGLEGRPLGLTIDLSEPAMGVAPGQAAVLYDGTRVVGSATITTAQRAATVVEPA
jgi:tRNA-uridine 2-sulfurtransferase